jgi:hypothetical protein
MAYQPRVVKVTSFRARLVEAAAARTVVSAADSTVTGATGTALLAQRGLAKATLVASGDRKLGTA